MLSYNHQRETLDGLALGAALNSTVATAQEAG